MLDIIQNPADAYRLYFNRINSANSEIMLLLPAINGRADIARNIIQSLQQAAKRGVQVKLLTPDMNRFSEDNIDTRYFCKESGSELPEIPIIDRRNRPKDVRNAGSRDHGVSEQADAKSRPAR